MGPTGRLVTIKRSGADGPHFPLSLSTCLFGRGIECDIRIQLPVVSKQHCKIEINGREAMLFNFSSTNPTQVNGSTIEGPVQLKHGDVITVVDRSFRYENESHEDRRKSTEFPGQRRKQESLHRVSRSSLSSDPDGKLQDSDARSRVSEDSVSGRPPKNVQAAGTVSGGCEDRVASRTPNVVRPSQLAGGDSRNTMDPTGKDSKEDFSITLASRNGDLKPLPSTRGLENGANNESPFKKLYESMKEELDVKSEKGDVLQSGKKSGTRSHHPPEKECSGDLQGGTQVPGSLKSRPRSGQSTQMKADPALGEQGISQTEDRRQGEEAVETPKETRGPIVPPEETTETKTLAPRSPQTSRKRQREDMTVAGGSASVNLDQKEGFRTDNKTFTPRKSLTRNQTPAKVENADNFGDTPENLFSKRRRSIPTSVDILTPEPETQNHAILAPLPVQVERKIPNSSVHQPEKVGATVGRMHSGLPGRSSVDTSNFGDSINKTEGTPLKRRRVSFGGRLKPELFDENLPPNTPLKRGETPRRSLVSHTPPVLKKIIKVGSTDRPQPSGKEDSSGLHLEVTAQPQFAGSPARDPTRTSPGARDPRRRSPKASSVSGGSKSHHADVPKRGGRKSGGLLSKRASIDRSQHDILQRIYSKRRSGASEANLVVAKSWADVVKLGAKQTQAKAVKHGPQRQLSKRPRKANTPKKPVSGVHSEFSTGHANSPCTIIIGKAHLEKVNVPARPYRMLNNFVINKKVDFNEDLSGLTEMFQTPAAKGKPQTMSLRPSAFSDSEDVVRKEFQVPDSGEKPLLCTSETFGENVFPVTQNGPQEPSDKSLASPVLRRQSVRVNVNIEKTPGSGAPKATSSANRLRRSVGPRSIQMPGAGRKDEEAKMDTVENVPGRLLRKTPQREQKLEGAAKEQESYFEASENDTEPKENSEEVVTVRRSRRYSEQNQEPAADLTPLKTWQDTEPKEDLGGIQGLLRTPIRVQEPKEAENKTAEKRQKSSKLELAGTPAAMSVQLETPPQKVDLEEEPLALGKPIQMPGGSTHSHGEPAGGDRNSRLFNRTPEQKLSPAEKLPGSKRRPRTPKKKNHSLEDLAGLRELFQTPSHTDKPMTGHQTTKAPCKSPLPGPGNTPASQKRRLETPPQKVGLEEEPSALRKPTQMPGESTDSHRETGGDDEDINLFNKTPGQKPNPAVTRSKRRPRTPKKKAHSLEDLAGLRELFQTPNHTDKPMADDPTTKAPCKSPLAELVNTPASRRILCKTPPQKVDLEEEASALQKSTQMPGESPHEHREPVGGDEDIGLFKETPKQKLDPAENAGSKRRPRTRKKKVQSLEDLVGLKELFQTPEHTPDPVTVDQTTRVPCKSPRAEPVNTPASRNRWLKTPQKVDLEEEPSALRKSTQMLGGSPHEHREPVGGDEDIKLFKETPKQELDPAENVAGSKRRPRTPKKKVHSLEDLDGLRGLFQTPDHTDKPMTGDQTTKAPCKSLLAGPGNTPASQKRRLETPPQKVGLEEKPPSLRKPTQMPGESTNSHREPGGDDEDINLFNKTPGQKPNPAVTRSKRRPRTPKKKAHSLEDLAGLRELFQTPNHTDKPMADDPTTKAPCKSPLAELVNTPASRRRLCKTPPQKVDLEEEASALQKSTQMPGESPHEHREPVGGDEYIGLFKEIPKQELDPAENVAGSKRRPRTRKKKVQSLEDLVGLKELFQTPSHTDKPMAGDQTTKAPCQSPLAGPGNTPASKKRWLETPPQKVGLEEEPPALGKSTQMPGESPHEHTESGGEDKDIKLFNKTPEQKLKPADNVTGSKRRPRTPQKKVQSLEDLVGLKELFQTPEQTKKTTAVVKTTIVPCKSPLAETVNTPTHMKTRLKVALGKVTVENELSAVTKPTQRPEEATRTHREPVGEDEDIRLFKETPKQKLKPEEDVTGSKRQPRTPKKKVQSLEDLVGLKELFQTPDPGTGDQTTKFPCKSPRAEPVNTPASGKRWLETPPQKVDLEEEPSALRKPTRMPGESPHEHREPGGKEEDINLFKETLKRKLNPTENVTGSKKQPRTPRRNIQSLEDLVGLKELFQTPNHTDKPMAGDQTTKAPCQSPLAGPGNKPTNRRRRLKTPPQKVDLEEEPSALRKPTQLPGESPHEHGEPVGGDADIGLFKDTPKPKLEPVRNVSRSKRRPRTPKKKVQSLEDLAGLKELFQTADPVTGDRTTKAPFQSPLAGPGNKPTNRRRRLKTPPQKADLKEEPSALRKPTQTPEESTHSLRESGGDDKDVKLFNRTAKQKLGPTENVTGRKNRPRAPNPTQPLEDLASFRESFPRPDHPKQRGDAGSIQGAPKQTPDGGKPVKPLARVRRAPRGKPVEDLAGHRDPVKSRSESSDSPSPKRKRGNEGGGPGTKRLRSVTPAQATAEEKPPLKKRRGAPREGRDPPEPLTAKRKLRVVAERMEVPEDLTSGKRESRTEGRGVGRTTASPQQAMSLRSRRPNKTKLEEQRPEPVKATAEKVKTDRNDKKARKTSQQTKPQSPEGRAKSSTPAGRVRASRMCLRSTRPRKVPLPDVAEEKQREKGVGVHVKNQEEEVTQRSDVMSLRSRNVKILPGGNALESESQQRVTRSAKRCAGNVKKDEDNACIKKIRTRSRRDNEDV
ncbi:proliferation marker protein Ki-67 isoform X1 [Felis catus]|uniref:proliferation marker protein Ki-67 isoform X1 n=1 Tax=Felis catus TaxID=9685 RepID=UPI001D19EAAA|nr:proliferation marker protein Ki-67 isoform X1 [Felis catus]XP_044896771.1 proliferation marker protein Ki-67 isoform X1 [Felis catus]XP_044896772.1 proliferation marker protein Ki-67 isoform X1 [Felis catus]